VFVRLHVPTNGRQPMKVERVPVESLGFYPGNPRRGNIELIAQSLVINGLYKPLVVQRSSGHVLAGNHTLMAAKSLNWAEIDVVFIDCDDDAARRIVLVDNKSADSASYDMDDLAAILMDVADFAGTGWTADELARFTAPLPDGFPTIDPDAPAKPGKLTCCPECGHEFVP
jgi:ParB-like chromosome segregation protein Spo0J